MELIIRSRYDERNSVAMTFGESDKDRSRTKQSFAKEADINTLMAKYQRTGILGDPGATRQPMYGDFTDKAEYQDNLNRIALAQSEFELLPSDIRAEFENNVGNLLDFIADPENKEMAVEMGLIAPESMPEAPEEGAGVPLPGEEPKEPEEPVQGE